MFFSIARRLTEAGQVPFTFRIRAPFSPAPRREASLVCYQRLHSPQRFRNLEYRFSQHSAGYSRHTSSALGAICPGYDLQGLAFAAA